MQRLHEWLPARGAGLGLWGSPWGLDCPCSLPTPSPGRLEHLFPGAAGQESPCAALWGGMPGSCWGRLSPSQRTGAWLQRGSAGCFRGVSAPAPPALQAYSQVRLLRALFPGESSRWALGAAKGPSAGSGETGLCLECVPLGGATQSVWPEPWFTVPGEVCLCWGCLPSWPGL